MVPPAANRTATSAVTPSATNAMAAAGEQRREVDEPVVEAQQGYSSILRSFS